MTYISWSIDFALYHCHRRKLFLYIKKWRRPGVFVSLWALALGYWIFIRFAGNLNLGQIRRFTWELLAIEQWKMSPYTVTYRPFILSNIFFEAFLGQGNICMFVRMVQVTWPRWLSHPYMVKPFKKSGTKRPVTLKICIQHWELGAQQSLYKINDDPGLTLGQGMGKC